MTQPAHRPRLISLPIFWQVLSLSLAVLVLALVINTVIVLKAPDPPPPGYSLDEAVTALKTGEVRLANGRRLRATTTRTAPAFVNEAPAGGPFAFLTADVTQKLAVQLGVPAESIHISLMRPHHLHRRIVMRPPLARSDAGPQMGPRDRQDADTVIAFSNEAPVSSVPPFSGPPLSNRRHPDIRSDVLYPPFSVAWKLPDGGYRVITPPQDLIAPWQMRLLMGFGLTALLILPLAWWLSQRLARPIVAFSDAAARIGIEDNAPPVQDIGPREVRQAAHVVNAMQTRIRKQLESRTALMGAIAHDLKTPLARMRLRIEDLPSPLKERLSDDIAHMDGLIRSAMSFTSAHRLGETLRPLDLSALVDSLAEDLGAVCTMEPAHVEPNLMVRGDVVAIKRIVTNLVENAQRYATSCRIELAGRGGDVELRVIDDGPGLPPEQLEMVFEPFYRLETSRNRDTGGTGLGLSVARSLAQAQGGTLTLRNRYEGARVAGLEALLVMPKMSK